MRVLGRACAGKSLDLGAKLAESRVLDSIAAVISDALVAISAAPALTADEFHSKFAQDGAVIRMSYAGLDSFFAGCARVGKAATLMWTELEKHRLYNQSVHV
eukprot:3366427-Pleurochrysis_carterae.AAC.4